MSSTKSIDHLIREMALEKAADLVIAAGYPPMIRVYSQWRAMGTGALDAATAEQFCLSMLTAEQEKRFIANKELDFAYHTDDLRFRVNLHYQTSSVAAALRLIPASIPSFESLGLPNAILEFCAENTGLILVTGPTGSGKTTTQAAMIDTINTQQRKHIITIEDPIEYIHSTRKKGIIEQREVGEDTFSFGSSLRHVLRQSPDVILIGEMRDLETISTAITAAETGHLVISTLHTNDTVQSIDRMIDIFPSSQQTQIRYQLSMTIRGVIAQTLLPRIDRPGSVPAVEILKATPAVKNLIRQSKTAEIYSLIELGKQIGMQSMQHALEELVEKGVIGEHQLSKTTPFSKSLSEKKVA